MILIGNMTKKEFKQKIKSVKKQTIKETTISDEFWRDPYTCNIMHLQFVNDIWFYKKYIRFVRCKDGLEIKHETSHQDVLALRIFYLDMFEQEILETWGGNE